MASADFSPAIRRLILLRDEERCVWCAAWWPHGMHLHHRMLRSRGGKGTVQNGISVCPDCHAAIHRKPEVATERGHMVPSWALPEEVPMLSWRGRVLLLPDGTVVSAPEPGNG